MIHDVEEALFMHSVAGLDDLLRSGFGRGFGFREVYDVEVGPFDWTAREMIRVMSNTYSNISDNVRDSLVGGAGVQRGTDGKVTAGMLSVSRAARTVNVRAEPSSKVSCLSTSLSPSKSKFAMTAWLYRLTESSTCKLQTPNPQE